MCVCVRVFARVCICAFAVMRSHDISKTLCWRAGVRFYDRTRASHQHAFLWLFFPHPGLCIRRHTHAHALTAEAAAAVAAADDDGNRACIHSNVAVVVDRLCRGVVGRRSPHTCDATECVSAIGYTFFVSVCMCVFMLAGCLIRVLGFVHCLVMIMA